MTFTQDIRLSKQAEDMRVVSRAAGQLLGGCLQGCLTAVRRLLRGCQEAVRRLLGGCQETDRRLLGGCQAAVSRAVRTL